MVQSYDNKERRRKALKRKKDDKKRNHIARDLATNKYRQRVREVTDKEVSIDWNEISKTTTDEGDSI